MMMSEHRRCSTHENQTLHAAGAFGPQLCEVDAGGKPLAVEIGRFPADFVAAAAQRSAQRFGDAPARGIVDRERRFTAVRQDECQRSTGPEWMRPGGFEP